MLQQIKNFKKSKSYCYNSQILSILIQKNKQNYLLYFGFKGNIIINIIIIIYNTNPGVTLFLIYFLLLSVEYKRFLSISHVFGLSFLP